MNHHKFFVFCTLLLTLHATTLSMKYDPFDPTPWQSEQSGALSNSAGADPLFTPHKMVALSPKPSPSKLSALHELIQSPDTHTADTQELVNKVNSLLTQYPSYLNIQNRQSLTAYELLLQQLQRTDLSTQARHNFEQLKILLDAARKQ